MVPPSRMSTTISGVSTLLASSITYLPFGPLTGLAYGNGLSLMKDYDNQYRVSSIAAGSVLSLVYQYSPDGNILSVSDALNPTTSALETSGDYVYEEGSNVLTSISGPQPATFVSDYNGNIISENTRTYAYDPLNRLVTVSEGGTQIASYTYNGLNQRTKKAAQAGTVIFHYDPQGHLIAETNNTEIGRASCRERV
jgi:YD repeat-containing protein